LCVWHIVTTSNSTKKIVKNLKLELKEKLNLNKNFTFGKSGKHIIKKEKQVTWKDDLNTDLNKNNKINNNFIISSNTNIETDENIKPTKNISYNKENLKNKNIYQTNYSSDDSSTNINLNT
jgi:hypothetical protein